MRLDINVKKIRSIWKRNIWLCFLCQCDRYLLWICYGFLYHNWILCTQTFQISMNYNIYIKLYKLNKYFCFTLHFIWYLTCYFLFELYNKLVQGKDKMAIVNRKILYHRQEACLRIIKLILFSDVRSYFVLDR
jgi:hypothetical protein